MFISRIQLLEVFFVQLKLNIRSEFARTYLSYAWWLLEPALMVAILYLVFGVFLASRTPDFLLFLVCGKIPFIWFSKSVTNSSSSIITGRGIINQVAIPKPVFPMLVVSQDLVKQIFVFLFMIVFVALYRSELNMIWLAGIFVMITQLLLICASALVVSAITPFLPDFKHLLHTMMLGLLLGSGVFYDYSQIILPKHQEYFLMNPVANLLVNYRRVFLDDALPDFIALGWVVIFSLAVIALMALYYRKFDSSYARVLLQ